MLWMRVNTDVVEKGVSLVQIRSGRRWWGRRRGRKRREDTGHCRLSSRWVKERVAVEKGGDSGFIWDGGGKGGGKVAEVGVIQGREQVNDEVGPVGNGTSSLVPKTETKKNDMT